ATASSSRSPCSRASHPDYVLLVAVADQAAHEAGVLYEQARRTSWACACQLAVHDEDGQARRSGTRLSGTVALVMVRRARRPREERTAPRGARSPRRSVRAARR